MKLNELNIATFGLPYVSEINEKAYNYNKSSFVLLTSLH